MSDGGTAMLEEEWCAEVEAGIAMSNARNRQVAGGHYKEMGVEPWDVIDTWPIEQQIGYYRGNLLKYTMRMGRKDQSAQEIAKAAHYAQKLQEVLART